MAGRFLGVKPLSPRAGKATAMAIIVLAIAAGLPPSQGSGAASARERTEKTGADWPAYGGQPAQDHYSSLSQINRKNVKKLKIAWTWDTGELGTMETTPVVVGHVLYTYTPSLKVVALDAVTGKLIWTFDSGGREPDASRGISYWTDGKERRILAGIGNRLEALDPARGKPIRSFGEGGFLDLRKGLGPDYHMQ